MLIHTWHFTCFDFLFLFSTVIEYLISNSVESIRVLQLVRPYHFLICTFRAVMIVYFMKNSFNFVQIIKNHTLKIILRFFAFLSNQTMHDSDYILLHYKYKHHCDSGSLDCHAYICHLRHDSYGRRHVQIY